MTAPISRQQHSPRRRLSRRQRCCKCRRKPAASARRLPRQRPRQTRPSAAQPPPRGIQAESGFPPGVVQLSGPAAHSSAQPHSASRSSSPSTGPNSRPCVSTTLARVLKSSASSPCLKSTRPLSRNQACTLNALEMNALEEQADNAKARDLYWKPLSWLGTIRPSSANDAFDPKSMGHFCLHDARFGGPHNLLSPPPP